MSQQRELITFKNLFKNALVYKRSLLIANVLALTAVLLAVPVPLLIPLLVDEVLLHQPATVVATLNQILPSVWQSDVGYVLAILLLTLLLRTLAFFCNSARLRLFTRIGKQLTYQIRAKLIHNLAKVATREFETLGSASINSRLVTDVETIDNFISQVVADFIVSVLSMLVIAVVLIGIHWQLGLIVVLLNPAVVVFTHALRRRVGSWKKQQNTAFEIFQQTLGDTLDAMIELRAANRERHFFGIVKNRAKEVRDSSDNFSWKFATANYLSVTLFLFGYDVFRALGLLMVLFSGLTIGKMMAIFGYLWFMMSPIQGILSMQYSLFAANAALKRINQILALPREVDYPALQNPFANKSASSLQLDKLSFAYNDTEVVLDRVDIHIQAGEKVAIVGASGGGKSTLVQLILGLYAPQSGAILFDGVHVQEIGFAQVREHVATLLQQPLLFNDSVRANLTMGRDWDDAALWQALKTAQLDDFIDELPDKLDSIIGQRGVRLSGGQRQRLAMARLLLQPANIIILDEATSALDSETERKLLHAIHQQLIGKTMLMIAHRLSAIIDADRIYVLANSRVVEVGSHQELIAKRGVYFQLYQAQL